MPNPKPAPTSPAPARVQVIAREYNFTLSRPVVPAGPVIIEFDNAGEDEHNLHLDPGSGEPETGSFPNRPASTHTDLQFIMRAGSYTLFCSLPSHRALGMEATLRVE
jgi:plastocyanin